MRSVFGVLILLLALVACAPTATPTIAGSAPTPAPVQAEPSQVRVHFTSEPAGAAVTLGIGGQEQVLIGYAPFSLLLENGVTYSYKIEALEPN